MFRTQDVISTFSAKSSTWDDKKKFIANKNGISGRLVKILPEFINPGMKILDIGFGTGKIVRRLKRLNNEVDITALDVSLAMALNLRLDPALDRIKILLSDAQNMCFQDNKFDMVTAQQTIHHTPYPFLSFKEIYRVLKPKGSALILTVGNHYQDDIFSYENGKMSNDLLGRINDEELYVLVNAAGLRIFTIMNDFFEMNFQNFDNYYEFMNAIGSVDKIFNYRAENVSNEEKKRLFYEKIFKTKNIAYNQPFSINGHYITIIAIKN